MALVAPPADRPVDVQARRVAPRHDRAGRVGRVGMAGLAGWCTVVVVALVWGTVAVRGRDVGLHAAPFKGHWAWHGGWRLLPAVGLGLAVAVGGPRVARHLPWRRVPMVAGMVATGWTTVLALGDGVDRLTAPLTTRFEYEPFAAGIGPGDLGRFLATYVDRLDTYPIHVQGHPPGPVVLAWGLDRIGLGGAGWLAAVAVGAWGVAVAATLVAARTVAGEAAARRAAPALAVLPAAVWAGTSVDPVFAALGAVAIALAVQARPVATVGSGLMLGAALLFSYGAVPLGAVLVVALLLAHHAPAAVPASSADAHTRPAPGTAGRTGLAPAPRRARAPAVRPAGGAVVHLGLVAVGALALLGTAAPAGFWWPAGLDATRAAYWEGIGSHRPGLYTTLVGNPAALAVALGPAAAVGLAQLLAAVANPVTPTLLGTGSGARATDPVPRTGFAGQALVGAAVVAVVAADLSQLARGEVERIWLPFVPWLALAAPGDRRGWLVAQVAVALAVQSFLVSPW